MKKILAGLAILALMAIGGALAQTGGLGAISTWPGAFTNGGFLNFRGGPQSSVIRATGGTFTCTTGGTIVVANTNTTANSVVIMSPGTLSGPPTGSPFVVSYTVGTGFSAKCSTGDTSIYNYWILG